MATETYYISGIAKFPRLKQPDEQYDNYSIGVILDPASEAEYANSGMQMKPRSWEGDTFITFRRPEKKLIKDELVKFGPPKVVDKDNNPITVLVGNGSKVTLKVIVYDSRKGKGHRLEAVRVDELVEFKPTPKADAPKEASKQMPF